MSELSPRVQSSDYIDLRETAEALISHWAWILGASFIFALIGYLYFSFAATPLYEADAMMIVNPGEREYVTSDQINSAAKLVDTYSVIITSDTVMDSVKTELDMQEDFDERVREVTVSDVNHTQIMRIAVTATDQETALRVCEKITELSPPVIVNAVKAGSVELISRASGTGLSIWPDVKKYTLYSAVAGGFLAAAVIILIKLMNNKVRDEKDILKADLVILGAIPSYEREER